MYRGKIYMKKTINNVDINYVYSDKSSDVTLVFLHGWGQNIQMMEPLSNYFSDRYSTLIIDLPGFGESAEPDYEWTVYDYAKMVHGLIKDLKIKKVSLIGHSFGGRVALVYASMYKVERLVCLASPYRPEVEKLPLKNRIYKRLKQLPGMEGFANFMKKHLGSEDYRHASEIMRGVLVKAINVNLTEDVKKIKCPTLLIWGDRDEAVDIKRAYELEGLIEDAAVISYEGASHYAYLEHLPEVANVLNSFL